jgi:hypothetical protein
MNTSDLSQYVDYARLAILVVVALLAALGAVRRSRPAAHRRDLAFGIGGALVVTAMGLVAPATSWAWVGAGVVVGFVLGVLFGRVRWLVAVIGALAVVYFAMALLWDTGGSFAPGLGMLALGGVGMPLGQAIRGPKKAG